MKLHTRCCRISFVFLALVSSAFGATWYVDAVNGSDNNSCQTATAPCKTIGHAISLASSGDTINVAAGHYQESITIPFSLSILGASPHKSYLGEQNPSVVTIPPHVPSSQVLLSGLTIQGGTSQLDGGGISNWGQLFIRDTIISGNTAMFGGGIATHSGVGTNATLDIDRSEIYYNTAVEGGGIHCTGFSSTTVRITNSTIVGNKALNGNGGGIYSSCQMVIINSTFTGNFTQGSGGAYYAVHNGESFLNVTISGNYAKSSGGGVFNGGNSGDGEGFADSIVAGNVSVNDSGKSANCGGERALSSGYNLSDDDSCNFQGTGDLNNTDPMLVPLFTNGGPTPTMALSPGSPAIDAGNPNGCPIVLGQPAPVLVNDQRGKRRPGDPKLKTGCDIGAYEYQFPQ
jgi:hypothetical protein